MTARYIVGDATTVLRTLAPRSVSAIVTSPPYLRQRQYGGDLAEVGRERSLRGYVDHLGDIFDDIRRVLRADGHAWLNIGDKSNGSGGAGGDWSPSRKRRADGGGPGNFLDARYEPTSFLDVPGAVVHELLERRWRLRMPIVWDKERQSPEDLAHVRRPRWQHEMIYLLSPSRTRCRFFAGGLVEKGSVWRFPPGGSGPAHLAPFPDELARRCILATTEPGDVVLDPFAGSGTVARVANELGRSSISIDLYPEVAAAALEHAGDWLTVEQPDAEVAAS